MLERVTQGPRVTGGPDPDVPLTRPDLSERSFAEVRLLGLLLPIVVAVVAVVVWFLDASLSVTALVAVAALAVVIPEGMRAAVGSVSGSVARRFRTVEAWDRLLWTIALVGVGLRVRAFLANRALWLDEAYLARSFLDRDLVALIATPLENTQSAPPGFLVLVHTSVEFLGFQEWSLRLPVLLASLATVVLAVLLARRAFTTRLAAVTFVTLVSLSPFLIYYSQEFKQYAFDALAAVVVLLVRSSPARRRRQLRTGLALAVIALVSLPGAVLVTLLVALDVIRVERLQDLWKHVPVAALTALGVLIHLVYTVRAGTDRAVMVAFWQGHSFPPDGGLFAQLQWHFDKALELMWVGLAHGSVGGTRVGVGVTWLVLLFGLVAANSLRRRTPAVEFALIAILGFVLLAQMDVYPLGTRLTLYMVPLFALLFAQGLESLWADGPAPRSVLRVVLAVVVLLPASVSFERLREPSDQNDIRLAVRTLNERLVPGDVVVANAFTRTAFNVYADAGLIDPRFSVRWTSDLRGSEATVREILDDVMGSEGAGVLPRRVWVVASHRTRELQEGARAAASGGALEPVCDRIRDGVLIALYAEDPEDLGDSMCDLAN